MKPEEIRLRLHTLIDQLTEDQLLLLQHELEKNEDPEQRQQLIARIIAEDAPLLKQLGR